MLPKNKAADGKVVASNQPFEKSVVQLLRNFAKGGYNEVAQMIEINVPEKEREVAARAYIKMINLAAFEAYNMSLAANNKPLLVNNAGTQAMIQDSLNGFSDMFFYGTTYFLQLKISSIKKLAVCN